MSKIETLTDDLELFWFSAAEREAYAELAALAALWKARAELRARADRAVRRARAQAPRVNGRTLELTDTWPGIAPAACNDEPIPLVTVRRIKRPLARILSSFLGCRRSSQTGG